MTLISSCEIHTTIKAMAAWPSFQLISSLQICYNQNSIWSNYIANNDLWTTEDGHQFRYFPRASCQIRKFAGCAYAGNAGNVFPATDFNGNRQLAILACITARTMAGKTFPVFPAHTQPVILRIWQEAHCCNQKRFDGCFISALMSCVSDQMSFHWRNSF